MLGLCIFSLANAVTAFLPTDHFSLSWQHSIEHFVWKEEYKIDPLTYQFYLRRVSIPGHGAGVDIPVGAIFIDDHWEFRPIIKKMSELLLANWLEQSDYVLCVAADYCRNLREFLPVNNSKDIIRLFICDQ